MLWTRLAVTFSYDSDTDAGFLRLSEGVSVETVTATESVNLDFDAGGRLIAIEILEVSKTAPALLPAGAEHGVAAE